MSDSQAWFEGRKGALAECAEELQQLKAQIAQLTAERDEARDEWRNWQAAQTADVDATVREIEERERLRLRIAALEAELQESRTAWVAQMDHRTAQVSEALRIADQALKQAAGLADHAAHLALRLASVNPQLAVATEALERVVGMYPHGVAAEALNRIRKMQGGT